MKADTRTLLVAAACVTAATPAFGSGIPTGTPLEEIVVTAQRIGLIGESRAASEGIVTSVQLQGRPILRPGEVLEVVPGLVVTQHSGDGKANQYFLRGFNLDHGTDFASYVDGVPVNMPTHAHGQGYADINFLIHELVDTVHYRKGPYFAEEGNFSAAGAARISYVRDSGAPTLGLTVGEDNYYRPVRQRVAAGWRAGRCSWASTGRRPTGHGRCRRISRRPAGSSSSVAAPTRPGSPSRAWATTAAGTAPTRFRNGPSMPG